MSHREPSRSGTTAAGSSVSSAPSIPAADAPVVDMHSPASLLRALAMAVIHAKENAFLLSINTSGGPAALAGGAATEQEREAGDGEGEEAAAHQPSSSVSQHTPDKFVFDAEDLRALHGLLRRLVDLTHPKFQRAPVDMAPLTVIEAILTLPVEDEQMSAASAIAVPATPLKKPSLFLFTLRNFEPILLHDVRSAMLMAALLANICSSCSRNHYRTYLTGGGDAASVLKKKKTDKGEVPAAAVAADGSAPPTTASASPLRTRDKLKKLLGANSRGKARDEGPATAAPATTTPEERASAQADDAAAERAVLNQVRIIRAVVPAAACWELMMVVAQRYKSERRILHFLLTTIIDIAFLPEIHYPAHLAVPQPQQEAAAQASALISEADCKALVDLVLPAYTEPAVVEAWLTALCNVTALHPRCSPFLLKHNVVQTVERLVLFHGRRRDGLVERGLQVLSNLALEVVEETSTVARIYQNQQQQQATPTE